MYIAGGKMVQLLGKRFGGFSVNIELLYDPDSLLLVCPQRIGKWCSKKNLYMNVYIAALFTIAKR
jgi:hypothetical protein